VYDDFNVAVPTSVIMRDDEVTWGYMLKHEPPWPADCDRCAAHLGTFDTLSALAAAIRSHVAVCGPWWKRAAARARRVWSPGYLRAWKAARAKVTRP